MMRKIVLLIVILAMLLSCRAVTGQPEQSQTSTPASQAQIDKPTEVIPPTPHPEETPIPLGAELQSDRDLNRFLPNTPIRVRFNQPMDAQSASLALITYPWVEGELSWEDGFTQLVFQPASGYTPKESYQVYLNQNLRGSTGGKFVEIPQWEIQVLEQPHVLSHQPAAPLLDTLRPEIRLEFDHAMDMQSVADGLSIEPEVPFKITWQDNRALISPEHALEPGKRYHFTMAGSARDQQGVPLGEDYRWDYHLLPLVSQTNADYDLSPKKEIMLWFNYGLEQKDPESLFEINPAPRGKWVWVSDQQARFQAAEPLPPSTRYSIHFSDELVDLQGNPIPTPPPVDLITPPPILGTYPAWQDGHSFTDPILITFTKPMDPASTQAAFHLEPATTGGFDWRGNTMVFQPEQSLTPDIEYLATLDSSALDAQGQPALLEPYIWKFTTYAPYSNYGAPTFGDYGPNAQVLDFEGRRAVQFYAANGAGPIQFELYRLSLAQFLDRYSSGFRGVAGFKRSPIDLAGASFITGWEDKLRGQGGGYEGGSRETLLPDDLEAGFYILNLSAPEEAFDQLLVVLTRNTLVVKQAEGQIVTWVSDINGAARPRARVSIYARNGEMIAQGRADDSGVYQARIGVDPQPLIVVAEESQALTGREIEGTDYTVSGLSNEWLTSGGWWGWWWSSPKTKQYAAFIYTDRPIYKPGQTVYFKALLRKDDDAAISMLPEGSQATVRIRDARNNIVQAYALTTNAFGTINDSFQLAEGAMLGDYQVEVSIAGESHYQIFKVQDYRKPDFQVEIITDKKNYVNQDSIKVSVDTSYFFGQPVAGASVSLKVYQLVSYQDYGGGFAEDKDQPDYLWIGGYDPSVTGQTDNQGHFVTDQLTAVMREGGWSSDANYANTWGVEATVDDGSHQTVSSFTVYKLYQAAEKLQLDTGGWLKTPGEPFPIEIQVADIDGNPVSGRKLKLELMKYDKSTIEYTKIVDSLNLTSDDNGKVDLDYTIEKSDYYQLVVSGEDERGNLVKASEWLYVYSPEDRWAREYDQDLVISADKASYAPGEVARLVIETRLSGPALLTFERGATRRVQPVELTPPLTLIEAPIQEDDAPNIFVTVNAWEEQDTHLTAETYTSLNDSRLRTAQVELKVPVTGKRLSISITPDRMVYAPRDQATFNLQVTDESGQPVQAELSAALVDEAIFSLSDDLSGPIFDSFYSARRHIVRSYDSMSLERYLMSGGRGGGGGGDSAGSPRSEFPDTAAWLPTLVTNELGEASITVTLPDSLTTWRLTARAITTDSQVGEASSTIITSKETVVRPILPRILTVGDELSLSAMVHNYSRAANDLQVAIYLSPASAALLQVSEPFTQTATLQPGEGRIFGWTARSLAEGVAEVVVSARPTDPNGVGDAVLVPLPIQEKAVPEVANQIGDFSGELNTAIILPEGVLESSTTRLELSRSIAGSLLTGLEYLTGYPYGCVEQTMSRALPNAVVGRAFYQLGISNPTLQADLPPMINAGLQRLYGYQHNDGGWGWWFDDQTNDYQTAWVIYGLAVTAEAGYEVDPEVIRRGAEWLKSNLENMDTRTQAFSLYSLAKAGTGDLEATKELAEQAFELDTFSQSSLALALHLLGAENESGSLMDLLAESAIQREGMVYWPQPHEDGHYYEKTMASSVRSTALALDAFLQINPDHPLLPGMVRWLMSQRRQQGWGSTNETAFTIIALTDHLLSEQAQTSDSNYEIYLNDVLISSGALGAGEPFVTLELTSEQLSSGINLLTIRTDGDARLYYSIHSKLFFPTEQVEASGNISIERSYLDPESGSPVETIQPGDLVRIELTVTMPDSGFYIIVEDKLPGGLEALNESLNTSSHEQTLYGDPVYYWQEYGYNNKEVRSDRVSFFITEIEAGTYTYSYLARATYRGLFYALPAEVYAMYDESLWGRSPGDIIQVGR